MTRFYYNGCTWSLAQRFHRQHRGRPVKVGPLKVDVPVRSTRKRALLVGISSSRHGPLFGARKDVLAMEKILIGGLDIIQWFEIPHLILGLVAELYGYDSKDIVVMLDGCQGCFVPTRANLVCSTITTLRKFPTEHHLCDFCPVDPRDRQPGSRCA